MLHSLRGSSSRVISPLVDTLVRSGLKPNMLSFMSLLFAFLAGYCYYISFEQTFPLSLALLFVAISSFFDFLDGEVARKSGLESRRGDLVDHVIDRYADSFILGGIVLAGYSGVLAGIGAIVGTLITSYLGTQAQALGLGRYYGGFLGRADRMIFLIIATILNLIYPHPIEGYQILGWLIVFFAVMTNLTAIQRFIHIWRDLERKT